MSRLPAFPEPVPAATASLELPVGAITGTGPETLDGAHERLTAALRAAGFDKWSVFAFKDGFALVTRWELIEEDGRPAKDRFPARHPKRVRPGFDFDEHVQPLFNAPHGDYRLFVFTVAGATDDETADVPIDGDSVAAGELPHELAILAAERSVTAHVYLFRQQRARKAEALAESPHDAATHLIRAELFSADQLGPIN